MKMFVTRWLATRGIVELEVRPSTLDDKYVFDAARQQSHRIGVGAFATRAEAVAATDAILERKRASLKKQLAKLDKLQAALRKERGP